MSRGPGEIERRLAELFAATRDRTLSVTDIADAAYRLDGRRATREQRLSATRAAHNVVRRAGYGWAASTIDRRLLFHPGDLPVQVWAVSIQPAGVIWAEAEITRITERNVMVRYAGEVARLDRSQLSVWWAWWRALRFVSGRTGRIATALDAEWWERYGAAAGGVPPAMQMPLTEAVALLALPENYTKDDVLAAFRSVAKKAHPDLGGTAEMFRKLVEARDRLLAALGTSAPPPKPPEYAPAGVQIVYRTRRSSGRPRLGTTRLLPK